MEGGKAMSMQSDRGIDRLGFSPEGGFLAVRVAAALCDARRHKPDRALGERHRGELFPREKLHS